MEWSSTADEKTMDIYFDWSKKDARRAHNRTNGNAVFMGLDFKTDRGVLIPEAGYRIGS